MSCITTRPPELRRFGGAELIALLLSPGDGDSVAPRNGNSPCLLEWQALQPPLERELDGGLSLLLVVVADHVTQAVDREAF